VVVDGVEVLVVTVDATLQLEVGNLQIVIRVTK
jgi:hypothetical protein